MEEEQPPPVRYRIVLEVTFPDADPWDASEHDDFIHQVKQALESAPNVKCLDVTTPEYGNIGPQSDYDEWRGGYKYDFSNLAPDPGVIYGVCCDVPAVDPGDLGRVWQIMSQAERGELAEFELALKRAIQAGSDIRAVLARVYILRVLQARNLIPVGFSEEIHRQAAFIPLAKPSMTDEDLVSLASLFV